MSDLAALSTRLRLRTPSGAAFAHWICTPVVLPPVALSPQRGHHILVLDASGSMYADMPTLRTLVLQGLTIEGYLDQQMVVSVLSYASSGDLRIHAQRVPIASLLTPESLEAHEIRTLQTRGLTCASQALERALDLVDDAETTALTLHSDGWFNDASPVTEKKKISAWILKASARRNLFVNTIAYRASSDFPTLDRIASSLSGRCVQVSDVRALVDAVRDTTALLAGRTLPARTVALEGHDAVVCYNLTRKKVNGTTSDLVLRGEGPDDQSWAWRFRQVSPEAFSASTAIDLDDVVEPLNFAVMSLPWIAQGRAWLAQGRLDSAKAVLWRARDIELIQRHARRPPAAGPLSHWAADWDRVLGLSVPERTLRVGAPQDCRTNGPTLIQLAALLTRHKDSIRVDLPALLSTYRRRTVSRLDGTRDATTGEVTPPPTRLEVIGTGTRTPILKMEPNTREATLNLTVAQRATLIDRATSAPVLNANGEPETLSKVRDYTLVADGEPTVEVLPIYVTSLPAWRALEHAGFIPHARPYDHETRIDLRLADYEVSPAVIDLDLPENLFRSLVQLRTVISICEACSTGKGTADLSDAQQEGLAARGVSAAGWYKSPTTLFYTDKEEAISKGWIDSYVRYQVDLGDDELVSIKDTYSGNELLDRAFLVLLDDPDDDATPAEALAKPTWMDVRTKKVDVQMKPPGKAKRNRADDLQRPIAETFTGHGMDNAIAALWPEDPMIQAEILTMGTFLLQNLPPNEKQRRIERLQGLASAKLAALWTQFSPVVFAAGGLGALPEAWDSTAYDATQIKALLPNLGIPRAAKDSGTFFRVKLGKDSLLITIHATTAFYTTEAGMVEVARLRKALNQPESGEGEEG